MGRLGSFIAGAAVGAGAVFGSLKLHVLRTNDGVQFVPKVAPNFTDIYVDIRHFGAKDWDEHKQLVAAIIHAKKESLLGDSASQEVRDGAQDFLGHVGFGSPDGATQH